MRFASAQPRYYSPPAQRRTAPTTPLTAPTTARASLQVPTATDRDECLFVWVRLQTSPSLALPMWLVVLAIPVGGAVLACHCLLFLARDLAGGNGDH